MSMENVISYEELEKRRRKSSASRKQVETQNVQNEAPVSSSMAIINEIFNPSLKIPSRVGPYKIPDEVQAGDMEALKDLDDKKLIELKEVFLLFDSDCDGLISRDDLRTTILALGGEAPDNMLDEMMNETNELLTYDEFVKLMSYRTIELDPEEVLLEAWSKWDDHGTGLIDKMKIYNELINYGDRLSVSEAEEALSKAPLVKSKTLDEARMVDYPAFCRMLCGLRKRKSIY